MFSSVAICSYFQALLAVFGQQWWNGNEEKIRFIIGKTVFQSGKINVAQMADQRISIPCKPVLKRIRYTTTQTALDRAERMENLHNAFRLRKNTDVRGLRVLLIDDVLTTGSTLSECALVLKRAGASSVYAATAARA
jgi:phosphoribosylpyrophosphate synthetase